MTDEEIWAAFYTAAGAQKALAPSAPAGPIVGRFISVLVKKLSDFWQKHKATLIPVLTQTAIAALDAIVANASSIEVVNLPGPD